MSIHELALQTNGQSLAVSDHFMEEIQQSLLTSELSGVRGVEAFESIFEKKRMICEAISEQRSRNQNCKSNVIKVRQRLCQIQQLAQRADRHSVQLRSQAEKINDAHMIGRILMMERIVKQRQDQQGLQERRKQYFRIREEKKNASLARKERENSKSDRLRQISLIQSSALRDGRDESHYQTIEMIKSKADKVREEKQRSRERVKRFEQFRLEQGRKNYKNKLLVLSETLNLREKKLDTLCREEITGQKQLQIRDYMTTLFATETM